MEISISFSDVNWLSVIVATLVSFAIGSLWYTPATFGTIWMKEVGLDREKASKANMPLIFGTTFILQFIASLGLELFLGKDATLLSGIAAGAIVSLIWIGTSFGTTYLFTQKSLRLYLIDVGYYLTLYLIMGAILGAW
jgi:hypothetical protein